MSQAVSSFHPDLGRFAFRQPAFSTQQRLGSGWQRELDEVVRNLRRQPPRGFAKILDLRPGIDCEAEMSLELLPGKTLEELVGRHGPLAAGAWCGLALHLLEIAECALDRPALEPNFAPASIFAWPGPDGSLLAGFASLTLGLNRLQAEDRWERWAGKLTAIWVYLVTGEWEPDFARLIDDRHRYTVRVKPCPALHRTFKLLLHRDADERPSTPHDFRRLLRSCAEESGTNVAPAIIDDFRELPAGARRILPENLRLNLETRDTTRPNQIPAIHPATGEKLVLHLLPNADNVPQLAKTVDLMRRGRDLPVTKAVGRWKIGGCRIVAEKLPPGLTLTELLARKRPMPGRIALTLGRQISRAMGRLERRGPRVPHLCSEQILLAKTPDAQPRILLRPLSPSLVHGADPAAHSPDVDRARIRRKLPDAAEGGFVELMARLLGAGRLGEAKIRSALQAASGIERFNPADSREKLLTSLLAIFDEKPAKSAANRAPREQPPVIRPLWPIVSMAATLIGCVAAIATWNSAEFRPVLTEETPRGRETPALVLPPPNLTPVSADAALAPAKSQDASKTDGRGF